MEWMVRGPCLCSPHGAVSLFLPANSPSHSDVSLGAEVGAPGLSRWTAAGLNQMQGKFEMVGGWASDHSSRS